MARYFKFHCLEEIAAEAGRLGIGLRFSNDFAPPCQPVRIGPLVANNAVCIQPMEGCDGTLDGRPDELTHRRFRRFGAGGAKLIWGEATAVCPEGRANPRQLLLNEATAPDLASLLEACREAHRERFGADHLIVGLQLTHSGRHGFRQPLCARHEPCTVANPATGFPVGDACPLLDDDYLESLVECYAVAARLARRCGFDFVDVEQCHAYLLNELLGARNRPGRFGGPFENRTRLATRIIKGIRAAVPDLLIACRLNAYDGIPYQRGPGADDPGEPCRWQAPLGNGWGTTLDDPFTPDLTEPLAWIARMRELGVVLINVTMGNPYTSPHLLQPFEQPPPDGYPPPEHPLVGVDRHVRLTRVVQEAFPDLAVVGSGYRYLQELLPHAAAANLRDRRVSFIGIGRASFSMPDLVAQLLEQGQLDRRRICRTFSYCTALMRAKHSEQGQFATGCTPFDREVYGPIWERAKKKPMPGAI